MNEKKRYEDKSPKICYPFGHKGKKYLGQNKELIECPKCKKKYEVSVTESVDPDFPGFCHAMNPTTCPFCNQKWWYRDGFEKS